MENFEKFGITVETILNLSPTNRAQASSGGTSQSRTNRSHLKTQLPDGNKFQGYGHLLSFQGAVSISRIYVRSQDSSNQGFKKEYRGLKTNDSVVTIGNNKGGVVKKSAAAQNGVIYAFKFLNHCSPQRNVANPSKWRKYNEISVSFSVRVREF